RGEVRLRDRDEMKILTADKQLKEDWVKRLVAAGSAWLWVQSLVFAFKKDGTARAAELLSHFEGSAESLKNLAYRLYNICEKKNWAKEATGYNDLVVEWEEILKESAMLKKPKPVQGKLL
ncbi:MAG: hypothetical protein IJG80_07860, partial [Selenomonadaceae bacterium]|nr:hypothetical protein [Selenomonadaceae bacterium]